MGDEMKWNEPTIEHMLTHKSFKLWSVTQIAEKI